MSENQAKNEKNEEKRQYNLPFLRAFEYLARILTNGNNGMLAQMIGTNGGHISDWKAGRKRVSDILSITTTSDVWYYGLDYLDGSAVSGRSLMSEIDVPEDYHGTTGNLVMSFFGFSNASEWYANLTVSAKNADEEEIGRVEILDAPFARNRSTEYRGSLFSGSNPFVVSLNTEWEEAQTLTW